jgi:hypothetical protein
MKFQLTFLDSVSGSPVFVTGLEQSEITFVREDNHSTVVTYSFFDEIGNGQYEFGDFDVDEVALNTGSGQWSEAVVLILPRINGVIQQGFSEIPVWNDSYKPVASGDLFVRVDKLGDTVLNYLTYDASLSGVNGFDPFTIPNDSYFRYRLPSAGWVLDRINSSVSSISGSVSGSYVTTNTTQAIVGAKTFSGGVTIDVGSSSAQVGKFRLQTASNPTNGGVIGYDFGYQGNNKPQHLFYGSDVIMNGALTANTLSSTTANLGTTIVYKPNAITTGNPVLRVRGDVTFTGIPIDIVKMYGGDTGVNADFGQTSVSGLNTWMLSDAKIPTNTAKYISNSYASNDYIPKKYVVDNFLPIGTTYLSNTVVIDKRVDSNVSGKVYSTINGAIDDLSGSVADDNIYTLLIKQDVNDSGYAEDVSLPDYFNLVGEGQVRIVGQLSRAGSPSAIHCKLENIHFLKADVTHAVDYVEAVDCVFSTSISEEDAGGGQVVLSNSVLRQSAFFGYYDSGVGVISNGNNQIFNCNGNVNVSWNALTDKVFSYNSLSGTTYGA